jgi:hypothetical protein
LSEKKLIVALYMVSVKKKYTRRFGNWVSVCVQIVTNIYTTLPRLALHVSKRHETVPTPYKIFLITSENNFPIIVAEYRYNPLDPSR